MKYIIGVFIFVFTGLAFADFLDKLAVNHGTLSTFLGIAAYSIVTGLALNTLNNVIGRIVMGSKK